MNPLFLYDNKLAPGGLITKNWIGPDNSNEYYIDSGYAAGYVAGTYQISSKNSEFISFNYTIHADFVSSETIFVNGINGNDTTGTGTYALPVKTIYKAGTLIDATHYQICIMESGIYTGASISLLSVVAAEFRIFTLSNIDVKILKSNTNDWCIGLLNDPAIIFETYNIKYALDNDITAIISGDKAITKFYLYYCQFSLLNGLKADFSNIIDFNDPGAEIYLYNTLVNASWIAESSLIYGMDNCIINIDNMSDTYFVNNISNNDFIGGINFYDQTLTVTACIFFNAPIINADNITFSYTCSNLELLSGTGNIKNNPLFINSNLIISIDYQLQLIILGFLSDSPCYKTGNISQTEDIGAWQYESDFTVVESYKRYLLEHNPKNLFMSTEELQMQVDYSLTGRPFPSKLNSKKRLEFEWQENTQMSENDRANLNRISQKKFDNIQYRTQKNIDILYFDDFENGIDSGSILAFDLSNDTIQVDKNINTEWIGFQIWLILHSVSGTIAGQIISGFTGLVVDSLIGYWVADYNSKMIYQIISNTATTITVHDPYEYLTDGTATVKIIKSIKIFDIEDDIVYLNEAPGALDTTAASWIIQEIILRTPQQSTRYSSEIGYRKLATPYGIRTGITYAFIEK